MADLRPCGTDAAYKRHFRLGEPPCDACRAAHAARCAADYAARKRDRAPREPAPREPAPREPAPCGTEAAARRHRRRGEPLDEACRRAARIKAQERRGRDPWAFAQPDYREVRNGIPWKPYVYRGLGYDQLEPAQEEAC
jgi:hypothetical protein